MSSRNGDITCRKDALSAVSVMEGTEVTVIQVKNALGHDSAVTMWVAVWVSAVTPNLAYMLVVSPLLSQEGLQMSAAVHTSFLLFLRYHLKDVIVGKIYFLLVRIKIKHMEIDIIKRETTGTGPNVYHENDTIAKYEIMDGAPVRGECPSPQATATLPRPHTELWRGLRDYKLK